MKLKRILTGLLAFATCFTAVPFMTDTVSAAGDALVSEKTETQAVQDVYLQAGSDADKLPTEYSNYDAGALRTKYSNNLNTQEYTRKTLLTFSLEDLAADTNNAELRLQLVDKANNPGADFSFFNVYEVEDWDASAVTWNTSPAKLTDTPIKVTGADIEGDIVHIDVSGIVENAVESGKDTVSFEFSIDTMVQDNLIDFVSTRSTDGSVKPTLAAWTNQIESVREAVVQTTIGKAPKLPDTVTVSLIDGTTREMEAEWDEIDPSSYAGVGGFTVSGVLRDEPSVAVSAKVTVTVDEDYEGTTYYLDATGGSDSNEGTSPEEAWQTLEKVNDTVFLPGDEILLKAGEIWNGQLRPQGSGTEGMPIRIGKYGDDSRRPVINGNGEGRDGEIYRGAVQLLNQEYWEISGLEVTNFRSDDPASTNDMSGSVRMGILIFNSDQENVKHGFVVRDCYIHDVVSSSKANTDEINYKMASAVIALGHYRDIKGNQLIAPTEVKASFDGVLFENNIVSNVSREGIRTHVDGIWGDYRKNMKDVVIRGNYIENVFGDGIVLSAVKEGGVVERNVVKNPCNKNTDGAYYAGAWAHWSDNALFQYNEVYGALYGSGDGEAFDADNACDGTVFQYNYSHDNNGGACLFMGGAAPKNGQHNTVFRYNVSANDGWRNQEILNDHTNDANDDGVPQVYNNTFYINGNVSTYLYSGKSGQIYVNFQNNIVLSESTGTLGFARYKTADASIVKNNIFWPESAGAGNRLSMDRLLADGNIFADPMLTDPSATLQHDEDGRTAADAADIIADSLAQLRERVSVFAPQEGSPAVCAGVKIEGNSLTEDIMGSPISETPTIGAIEYVEPESELDLKALEAQVSEGAVIGSELEKYEDGDGKTAFTDAFAAAEDLLERAQNKDPEVTQSMIDDAAEALAEAIGGLSLKPEEPDKEEPDKEEPDKEQPDKEQPDKPDADQVQPDKNKPSDSGKASDVPKTGDSGTETAALYIAAVAAAAGAVTLRRKKSV